MAICFTENTTTAANTEKFVADNIASFPDICLCNFGAMYIICRPRLPVPLPYGHAGHFGVGREFRGGHQHRHNSGQ